MADLSVNIAGVSFKNPVIPASGTFGYGREYAKFYDIGCLGGIAVKGTTLERREGNPPPRVAETPAGMLNSVGLQNPGVEYFIREELPYLKNTGVKIIANIAGSTPEDYAEMARRLNETDVDMIELNISCPNVKCGGAAFGTDPKVAGGITRLVKDATKKPVMVKLTPNVTDIALMAKAVESEGADAVSLINTLLGMRIDIKTKRPVLKNNVGGLSGPAVFPIAVRMVWQVANAVKIPVIGMGGIATWKDAVEMMMAGASAIQIGAALFTDPYAPVEIIDGLNNYLDGNGIACVSDIVGAVQPW